MNLRHNDLVREKRKHIFNIIVFSIILLVALLLYVGTLILQFNYPNIYLTFDFFIVMGRIFLFVFCIIPCLCLINSSIKLHSIRKQSFKRIFIHSKLENTILQFLIENRGDSFTSSTILKEIPFEASMEELNTALTHLVKIKKIRQKLKELTPYYSINVKKIS